ncbi:MAG: cellulase family glycosylhydrolase [Chitinophagales bacterium]|nr:cellulase family glycosylhydrolase [Chitinophagales bacterium]OJV27247.1 MAG: hypothetical protein BGO32_05120 [Bacteroidetes bacterium 37-13]
MSDKYFYTLVLLIFSALFARDVEAQSVAQKRCDAFGKGQNLSNWLEATWQNNWPTPTGYTKASLQKMKDAGITSLRLPINFAMVTDTAAPYAVNENHVIFSRIDSVIAWCTELDMMLIIDNHHGWNIVNTNWRKQAPRFAHLWAVLSNRYKNLDPERFTFELLNEPGIPANGVLDNDTLSAMFAIAIDSIRKNTTAHSIIVSPSFGSWGLAYENYTPLTDTNLIYTWHLYDPINFTHQGFSWNNPVYPTGIKYPDNSNMYEAALALSWQHVLHFQDSFQKPIFLGEFGVSHYADTVSRCNWIEYVGTKILQHNISWFYWDWGIDFTMFNAGGISENNIIPCFKRALRLYGDTTFTSIQNLSENKYSVDVFPSIVENGMQLAIQNNFNKPFTIQLVGTLGNSLWQQKLQGGFNQINIDVPKGFYFVLVETDNYKMTKRIVVQ